MILSDREYYERLKLLLERVVLAHCKKLFRNYLQSNYLTLFTFLDRNKHRIMHCFRYDTYCCFKNKYKCVLNNTQTLTEYAWRKIYMDMTTVKCVKDGCICHVLTKSRRMPKMNVDFLTFLIREFNIVEYKKFPAVYELEKFHAFFQNLENTRVTRDEYQRVWNKVSESLMILGLEIELIDDIQMSIPSPVPVKRVSQSILHNI